jgi:hypothetical protein
VKITRQKLYAVLRKAGFDTAKYHASGQVRGWGSWSPGARVEEARGGGAWNVSWKSYGHISAERYQEYMERIITTLQAAGIEGTLSDDKLTYRVSAD